MNTHLLKPRKKATVVVANLKTLIRITKGNKVAAIRKVRSEAKKRWRIRPLKKKEIKTT
jgi:hypothetical protein